MPFEGHLESSPTVPTPATPGVWAVSHCDIDRNRNSTATHPGRRGTAAGHSSFELVTDVTFVWPYPAKSAFVTGNFSNWETTVAMVLSTSASGSPGGAVWTYSKALPPGDYQYKFIIDNVWRHAPDQPIIFDERGIINNFLTVTVELCGDATCFCSNFFSPDTSSSNDNNSFSQHPLSSSHSPSSSSSATEQLQKGLMTPNTVQRIRRNVGVAYRYIERDITPHSAPFKKAYMHADVSDRPFDVTVVNVETLSKRSGPLSHFQHPAMNILQITDSTISRASSYENVSNAANNNHQLNRQTNLTDSKFDRPWESTTSTAMNTSSTATAANSANTSSTTDIDNDTYNQQPDYQNQYYYHNIIHESDQNVSMIIDDDAAYAAKLNEQGGTLPHTAPYRASLHCSDPTQLAYSVRARLSSPVLGFNPKECHEGIKLTDTNHCAVRIQERGMYKTVRSVLPLRQSSQRTYFELFIFRQATIGGVCIGLSTPELPLNCLCGTRPNSVGYSSSGNLIQTIDGKESWSDFGDELQSGCTVGCLVSMTAKLPKSVGEDEKGGGVGGSENKKSSRSKLIRSVSVDFYANGQLKGTACYEFVGDLDVYPTLSLFAKHAQVYSLFSGQDMLYTSCLPADDDIITLDGQKVQRCAGTTPRGMGLEQTPVNERECILPQR